MEEVSEEELNEAIAMQPQKIDKEQISDEEFQKMLIEMQNPVQAQKRLAVQIKIFLDSRIKEELESKGILSDHTRRWVESYNGILEKIQKAIHGDKSVNLHLHKVSHSDISNKIRESIFDIIPLENKRKSEN